MPSRQRRLNGVDEVVPSLYADCRTGEIGAHFADVYDASVSKDTVTRITDRMVEEKQACEPVCWSGPMPPSSSTPSR
jgi:putative transposase